MAISFTAAFFLNRTKNTSRAPHKVNTPVAHGDDNSITSKKSSLTTDFSYTNPFATNSLLDDNLFHED